MSDEVKTTRDPFAASQPVWVVDADRMELDKMQNSLSPELLHFDDLDSIIQAISTRFDGSKETYGTFIITQNQPSKLKAVWSTFVQAMNSLKQNENYKNRLFIFEINPLSNGTHIFYNSQLYESVDEFLADAHNVHIEAVTGNTNISEEARRMITDLKVQQKKTQADLKEAKKQNKEITEQKEDLAKQLSLLKAQIDSYKQKADSGEKAQEEANKLIEENQLKMKSLQQHVDDLQVKQNESDSLVNDLKVKNTALDETIQEQNLKITSLNQTLIDKDRQIEQQNAEQSKIINARNSLEETKIVQERLNAEREKRSQTEKINVELQQKLVQSDLKIKSLTQENNNVRQGYKSIERVGYTNEFTPIKLGSTNVMYFKIIDELPFHRFYIDELQKLIGQLLEESNMNQYIISTKIVYFKVDYGSDKEVIGDYPLIGNLSTIDDNEDHYRLIPGPNINEAANDFDTRDKLLIFVDYISNDKYYIETNGNIDYYVISTHEKIASDLKLKGSSISYDRNTLLDLEYDKNFINLTEKNRIENIQDKLTPLIEHSTALQRYMR